MPPDGSVILDGDYDPVFLHALGFTVSGRFSRAWTGPSSWTAARLLIRPWKRSRFMGCQRAVDARYQRRFFKVAEDGTARGNYGKTQIIV